MTANAETVTRAASTLDVPALKALWLTVFGDRPEDTDRFFETYFTPDLTAVIDGAGVPVAVAYAVPDGELVLPDDSRSGCAMIYAVATHPSFRGLGYGAAVTTAAARLAAGAGRPAAVLKPADAGLFAFYEKHTEFRSFFDVWRFEFPRDSLPAWSPLTASPAGPEDYRRLRSGLLSGTVHIDTDERGLGYQLALCRPSGGGGLFALTAGSAEAGCAFADREGGTLLIKELLLTRAFRASDAVAALAVSLEAERYLVRTADGRLAPAGTQREPFGMLMPFDGLEARAFAHSVKWYGPAFD